MRPTRQPSWRSGDYRPASRGRGGGDALGWRAGRPGTGRRGRARPGAPVERRQEHVTGRLCARETLGLPGHPPLPPPPGPRRAPRWPAGAAGSVTHCRGFRAATADRRTEVRALGVGAGVVRDFPSGIRSEIASPAERSALDVRYRTRADLPWYCVLFSAKEAVYKARFTQRGGVVTLRGVWVPDGVPGCGGGRIPGRCQASAGWPEALVIWSRITERMAVPARWPGHSSGGGGAGSGVGCRWTRPGTTGSRRRCGSLSSPCSRIATANRHVALSDCTGPWSRR
ncbi:4'-phosphopantetheinyl transferase superfamily protein [Streptomyces sp. NPDC014623]|uniref:4'-phosphopantetheinyl transferase superfamily protein n=1 Tax=Streptomyces sp. NPDC014623 TaxID=3364875 RepID=UPI0036F73422